MQAYKVLKSLKTCEPALSDAKNVSIDTVYISGPLDSKFVAGVLFARLKRVFGLLLWGFKVLRVIEENACLKKYSSLQEKGNKIGF